METPTVDKTHFQVFANDETHHWNAPELVAKCGKIKTVYLYDSAVVSYVCSTQPMYGCTPLYYITENEIDEATSEILHEEFAKNETEIRYFLLRDVMNMERVEVGNDQEVEDFKGEAYQEICDEMEEYCKCNHQI